MEKTRNHVLRKIADSNERIEEYIPSMLFSRNGTMPSYAISVKLPKDYKKFIPNIIGSKIFRDRVKEEIEKVFSTHIFNNQSYLKIHWLTQGPSFETDGVNGCMVYVPYEDQSQYSCHNIDNYEQASVLYIALLIYLQIMHFALESLVSGTSDLKNWPAITKNFVEKIELNRVKGCQMDYEQCINKGWICEICTRNPKAFRILEQKDLNRIGDKWEPPGGLPGRKLCPVCGANISSDECPYCQK